MERQWSKNYQHVCLCWKRLILFWKNVDKLVEKQNRGYILEAHVEHVRELHKKYNKLPMRE